MQNLMAVNLGTRYKLNSRRKFAVGIGRFFLLLRDAHYNLVY